MIVRRCAEGHDITLHKNTKPGMSKRYPLLSGDVTILTYPSDKKDYFVVLDGAVIKRSDSFKTAEEEFVKTCESKHTTSNGRIDFKKHKLINNMVHNR